MHTIRFFKIETEEFLANHLIIEIITKTNIHTHTHTFQISNRFRIGAN